MNKYITLFTESFKEEEEQQQLSNSFKSALSTLLEVKK